MIRHDFSRPLDLSVNDYQVRVSKVGAASFFFFSSLDGDVEIKMKGPFPGMECKGYFPAAFEGRESFIKWRRETDRSGGVEIL